MMDTQHSGSEQPYPFLNPTYVFSDIVDSSVITKRLEAREDTGIYEAQLRAPYLSRVDALFKEHHGFLIQLVGDGHMLVFQYAKDALSFAVALQESLHRNSITYGTGAEAAEISVRIGVHTTVSQREPSRMKNDLAAIEYVGSDTNFASRIMSLGADGQIIVSAETHRVTNGLAGYRLYEWPNRLLKSFEEAPHTVYEILYFDGQKPREPGIRFFPSFYQGEHNRYIEREDKERELVQQFSNKHNEGTTSRFVTVKGEGGMGKTRLAVSCAVKMVGQFEGGAHLVDLTNTSPTEGAVAEAIGSSMQPPIEPALPDALLNALKQRGAKRTLLILDNYEPAKSREVGKYLSRLVTETRGVYLLVTSRAAVDVTDVEKQVSLDDGMNEAEARELFLARARLKNYKLKPQDEPHLKRILRLTSVDPNETKVSAIPLAVELAAAWSGDTASGLSTLREIADGLENTSLGNFSGLPDEDDEDQGSIRANSRQTGGRQDSLTRSLNWSFNLLGKRGDGKAVQHVFAACGLFADSFDAETVAAITHPASPRNSLRVLQGASLVRREEKDGATRYHLHRFTREYARQKLAGLPEADIVRRLFVVCYIILVGENAATRLHMSKAECRAVLDYEWRNVLSAIDIAMSMAEYKEALALAKIRVFFDLRNLWFEWENVENQALTAARANKNRHSEGAVLGSLGHIYHQRGQWSSSIQMSEDALAIFQGLDNRHDRSVRHDEGAALSSSGNAYMMVGRLDDAIDVYDQALIIWRELGDRYAEGITLGNRGVAYAKQGRAGNATQMYEQSLSIMRDPDKRDQRAESATLVNLSNAQQEQGQWSNAIRAQEQARSIAQNLGDQRSEGLTQFNTALLWMSRGELTKALLVAREAVALLERTQDAVHLAKARQLSALIEAKIERVMHFWQDESP